MKKALIIAAALLVVTAFAPAANAQSMLEFDAFCDGLSLSAGGGAVSGEWCSYDCAGSNDAVAGSLTGGVARVLCGAGGCGTCAVGGDWGFVLDGLDGTMDMYLLDAGCGGGDLWIDELAYNVLPGDCSANPGAVGVGGSITKGWIE